MKRERDDDHTTNTLHEISAKKLHSSFHNGDHKTFKWIDCIYFCGVRNVDDIENPTLKYQPLFIHHFFPYDEEVSGFSFLSINIFYTVDTLDVFIQIHAERDTLSAPPSEQRNTDVLDHDSTQQRFSKQYASIQELQSYVVECLSKKPFPGKFHTSLDEYGTKVYEFDISLTNPTHKQVIQLRRCTIKNIQDSTELKSFHLRLEWFMHFFLEAFSNIEWDKNWTVYLILNVYDSDCIQVAGLLSHYNFFCLPKLRVRISQFLVLPPFQNKDIGLRVLLHVYTTLISDASVGNISVESPAESFSRLQDVVHVLLAIRLGIVEATHILGATPDSNEKELHNSIQTYLRKDFLKLFMIKLKINLTEAIRAVIIICLALTIPKCPGNEIVREPLLDEDQDTCHYGVLRHARYSLGCPNNFLISPACKDVRIFVKKRARKANIEILALLSPNDQCAALDNIWREEYKKYYRSVGCVRRVLQNNL